LEEGCGIGLERGGGDLKLVSEMGKGCAVENMFSVDGGAGVAVFTGEGKRFDKM